MTADPEAVLGAVEACFGAGVTAAHIAGHDDRPGAWLFRYLPALEDPWCGGLHLDRAPADADELRAWLSTWQAFERPGRLRWVEPRRLADRASDQRWEWVQVAVASDGFVPVLREVGEVATARGRDPEDVTVTPIVDDPHDWAGFEVLARWIDSDEDPDRWRFRAKRVRHLVEAGRGRAVIARTPAMPVGAAVLLDAPDHRPGGTLTLATVVHGAHRGRGIGALLAEHAHSTGTDGTTITLGPTGMVGNLVEVGSAVPVRPERR